MKSGYYWLRSERSSTRSVAQLIGHVWFLIGEADGVGEAEIRRRGWEIGKRIKGQDKP